MLRRGTARGAQRRAQHHRHFELAARHVVNLRGLVDHLIHGQRNKIAEHDVDHRPHAGHRRADADTGNAGFRNRRVDDALGAELFHQPGQNFERRARLGDIFADDKHRRIAPHFFGQRFVDRLAKGDLAHANGAASCFRRRHVGRLRPTDGKGALSAKFTAVLISAEISLSIRSRSFRSAKRLFSSHAASSCTGSRFDFHSCSSAFER